MHVYDSVNVTRITYNLEFYGLSIQLYCPNFLPETREMRSVALRIQNTLTQELHVSVYMLSSCSHNTLSAYCSTFLKHILGHCDVIVANLQSLHQ